MPFSIENSNDAIDLNIPMQFCFIDDSFCQFVLLILRHLIRAPLTKKIANL